MSPGFGGGGYATQESRALSSISETPSADLSQGQEAAIKMLQSHDSQIKFLAGQMQQAQKGINDANQNPIQQIQSFISDIVVLLGGGELATGALDFGDLQYILPVLGALFGFGDGPFPISLFEAAEKFFFGSVVPQQQFVDLINRLIESWLGVFGIDAKFVADVKALITAVGDLFEGVENLFPSLNELFGSLGISGANLGPLGQLISPIIHLFSGLDLKNIGSMVEFITDAIDPFIVNLTKLIDWVDSILAVFGFEGGSVVNNPLSSTTSAFQNLVRFLGDINLFSPTFNLGDAAEAFISLILSPTGLLATLEDIGSAIGDAFEDFVNFLISLIGPIPIIGSAIKNLANFIGLTHNAASSATTTQSQQTVAKPGYVAMDASADAVFPIANISGATPSTINVTSATSIIGFIDTPDNGRKQSIIWLGSGTTNLTGLYVNLYKLDVVTGVATLLEESPNILSSVANALSWNYYNLVTTLISEVGHVYAVELLVTGTGTYKIAGLPSDWKPANTASSYPHQLGSGRTTSLRPAPATFTPNYSGVVPWFGLGGFLFAGPTASQFATAGTYTYTIPNWMKFGDCIDVVALGGGGGGQSAAAYFIGNGGGAGKWTMQTLRYGIDIPTSTTVLTLTVGTAGGGAGGGLGAHGSPGTLSSLTGTGVTEMDAAGGPGGGDSGAPTGGNQNGASPGTKTFNGITYTPTTNNGKGGTGAGAYGVGQRGNDGEIWMTAYQAGTTP